MKQYKKWVDFTLETPLSMEVQINVLCKVEYGEVTDLLDAEIGNEKVILDPIWEDAIIKAINYDPHEYEIN